MPKSFSQKSLKFYRHKNLINKNILNHKKFLSSQFTFFKSLKTLFLFGHIKNVQNPFLESLSHAKNQAFLLHLIFYLHKLSKLDGSSLI